jgi:hypothetical protein
LQIILVSLHVCNGGFLLFCKTEIAGVAESLAVDYTWVAAVFAGLVMLYCGV